MAGQERILRRRIRSVQSTKKITRAMELIAGSRIVKAQARVAAAVPYADGITAVVQNLNAAGASTSDPILAGRDEIKRVAHVAITADRGLCGGYNSTVIRAAEGDMKHHGLLGRGYRLYPIGRKAEGYFRYRNFEIAESYTGFSDAPTYEDARRVAADLTKAFLDGDVDLIHIVYTRFHSAGSQEVVVIPLIPLADEDFNAQPESDAAKPDYEFEPSPSGILEDLLPRYVEARVYAAMLNAAASEHAARQRAMKAATDNADELIRNLSRIMNRARQDAITTEIMEIVSGAEALGQGSAQADDAPAA